MNLRQCFIDRQVVFGLLCDIGSGPFVENQSLNTNQRPLQISLGNVTIQLLIDEVQESFLQGGRFGQFPFNQQSGEDFVQQRSSRRVVGPLFGRFDHSDFQDV